MYIGRRPMLLRIYDKIQELKYHGVDPSSFPLILTRIEWESHGKRWNALPHKPGAEITHFSDLPNLLVFQPFARAELLDVPFFDFENETQGSIRRLTFKALAEQQSAQAATSILNKKRNFSRDYRQLLLNNEAVLNRIQQSYVDTTRLFFNNQGADVRFLYDGKAVVPKPHDVERYDIEIVDPDQIPREFLQPNNRALWRVVRELGTEAEIPGVRVVAKMYE